MSKVYQNRVSVDFMIWETKENLRAVNNKTNVISEYDLAEGDVLIGGYGEGVSSYTITSIISKRDANTKKGFYYELHTVWQKVDPKLFLEKDLTLCDFNFNRFVNPAYVQL